MTGDIVAWAKQLDAAVAAASGRPGHTLAALATVRGPGSARVEGRPSCRTVNIRRYEHLKFYFVSDTRSGKADDVTKGASNFAELCWYFGEAKKQFRFCGALRLRQDDEITRELWDAMPDADKRWWMWPAPGQPRGEKELFEKPTTEAAPKHFCVCELQPDFVDVLDLNKPPFMREMHDAEASPDGEIVWQARRVNP